MVNDIFPQIKRFMYPCFTRILDPIHVSFLIVTECQSNCRYTGAAS